MTPLAILLIEDTEDDALLISIELQIEGRDVQYHRIETEAELREALQVSHWDAVLSDYLLPGFSGLAALKIVQQHDPDLPFLLVSGAMGEETAVEAMRAGAHDYIMKDRLARLAPALERELREAEERRARRRARTERKELLARELEARDRAEKATERIARLQALTAELSTSVTPADVAAVMVDKAASAVGAIGAQLSALLKDGSTLQTLSMSGPSLEEADPVRSASLHDDSLVAEVIRTCTPAWLPPVREWSDRYPEVAQAFDRAGYRAAVILPVWAHADPIGALIFGFGDERGFDDDDQAFFLSLAQQAGQALERASLYESVVQSEARFHAQFLGFPLPTYTWQARGDDLILMDYNNAGDAMTQEEVRAALGSLARDMYAERPDIFADLMRCLHDQTTIRRELHYRFATVGTEHELVVHYIFVPPDLVMVHTEDVTDRVRAEQHLRFQARLLDTVGQSVIATTPDGKITYWNRGAERLFLFPSREVVGRNVLEVIPTESSLDESRSLLRAIVGGRERIEDIRVRRRDGSMVPVLVHTTPIYADDGAITGIIGVSSDISELKEIEQDLRMSEERFRAIFDEAAVGVGQTDLDGRLLLVNDHFLTMLGYSREEFRQTHFQEFTHPDDLEANLTQLRRVQDGEITSYCLEKRFVRKDGTSLWAEVTSSLMSDREGIPRHMLTVMVDIDARKRAEEMVRTSEQRIRRLMADVHVGIVVQDPDARILSSNPAACAMLGLTDEQLRGMTSFDSHWNVIHEDGSPFPPDTHPQLQALTTRRPVHNVTMGVLRPERGDRVWILLDAEPQFTQDGSLDQVVSTFVDITERHEAEHSLAASEQRYRGLVETSPDGILLNDMYGIIVTANRQLATMLGYDSPDDIQGRSFAEHLPADDRLPARELLEQRAMGTLMTSINTRYSVRRRDGSTFPAEVSSFIVPGAGDEEGFITSTVRDVTDRVAYETQLEHLALHDPLTGLANRTLLYDRLQQALAAARRTSGTLAVLLLDLERFKEINDTFGHQIGDEVIREVGIRLNAVLRESDTLARLGGDEYVMLLPHADLLGAIRTATKLGVALEQPIDLDQQRVSVGTSIGIALYPEHGDDPDALIRHADVAMYSAKEGNSGYAVYAAEKDFRNPMRLALSSELRDAIQSDQLVLHYQPKMRFATGEIEGVEALVRWHHPEHGLVLPDQFIPLAEHSGLIRPLTSWVIEHALTQSREWRDLGLTVGIAVNFSARSLHDPDLPGIIKELLATSGAPPAQLTVEITESVIMADPDHAMEMLGQLTDIGIRLSIDDFGTGYSSLAYLRHLRAHELKIDKSFVIDLDTNPESSFIVRSIIELGHNLGLTVVAEGVESQNTLDILATLRCDYAQGYHLGPPQSGVDSTRWLQDWKRRQTARGMERPAHIAVIDDETDILDALESVLKLEGYAVTLVRDAGILDSLSPEPPPDLFLIDIMLPGLSGIDVAKQLCARGFEDVPMIAMSASDLLLQTAVGTELFRGGIEKPFDFSALLSLIVRLIASKTPGVPDQVLEEVEPFGD